MYRILVLSNFRSNPPQATCFLGDIYGYGDGFHKRLLEYIRDEGFVSLTVRP